MRQKWIAQSRRRANILDFGAVADASTDCTAAINAAIQSISGIDNQFDAGVIEVPTGADYYLCNGTLHFDTDGLWMVGAGPVSSQIVFGNSGSAVWTSPVSEGSEKVFVNWQKTKNFMGTTISGTAEAGSDTNTLVDGLIIAADVKAGDIVRNTTTGAWAQIISVGAGTCEHTPLSNGSAWNVGDGYRVGGPAVIRYGGMRDLAIDTIDQAATKVGLRIYDGGELTFSNVAVGHSLGRRWYGGDSCAIRVHGREFLYFTDQSSARGAVPLRISPRRTRYSPTDPSLIPQLSFDHCAWDFGGLDCLDGVPATLPHANILIDDTAVIDTTAFRGINFVGGKYMVHWADTTGTNNHLGATFEKLRWEQVDAAAVTNFHIECQQAGIIEARFRDCDLGTSAGNPKGFYLRGVQHGVIQGNRGNVGGALYDIANGAGGDAYMRSCAIEGNAQSNTAVMTLGANIMIARADPHAQGNPGSTLPPNFTLIRTDTANTQNQFPARLFSAHEWAWGGQLTDDQFFQIPVNNTHDMEVGMIHVAISDGATRAAAGMWMVCPAAVGTQGVLKVSGTANTVDTDTDTNLCVYGAGAGAGDAPIYVRNRLGATCWAVIRCTYKKSVET